MIASPHPCANCAGAEEAHLIISVNGEWLCRKCYDRKPCDVCHRGSNPRFPHHQPTVDGQYLCYPCL